jgi:hypothetical protein
MSYLGRGNMFTQATKRNVMGGTNVITYRYGAMYHVASYSTASNARRAIRTGAALRVAIKVEES